MIQTLTTYCGLMARPLVQKVQSIKTLQQLKACQMQWITSLQESRIPPTQLNQTLKLINYSVQHLSCWFCKNGWIKVEIVVLINNKSLYTKLYTLPICIFCLWCGSHALVAQLDRVQVSEACGVGSSPAERTIFLRYFPFCNRSVFKTINLFFHLVYSFISLKIRILLNNVRRSWLML